ncbi:hypothetical protein EVAR_71976_1 [Eumeta japonica]|uniref:Uncharacterized protein n=1 Tax=Eumeta variegata TaxID=151549 RepID=A0A4C1SYN6_EUMVA|nr:hypothetical protein EVAR_71976_1 [Eumeta japonica]
MKTLNVCEQSADCETSKTSNNILPQLRDEKSSKSKASEESGTEDSISSSSEYESSSSDTGDKSTEDSYKRRSSSSESSDTDTENDLRENEMCNVADRQPKKDELNQTDSQVSQKQDSNISEKNAEANSCSAQTPTVANAKFKLDNEKDPSSPQRIVIRITKSLSPNEQSLRVESISSKPFETQDESDDYTESGKEEDEDMTKIKEKSYQHSKKDLVITKLLEQQIESEYAEDCKPEKKLSLKLQTDCDTESESENEENPKKNTKAIKWRKTQEEGNGKYTKKLKLKRKRDPKCGSDKPVTCLTLSPEKLKDQKEELKADIENIKANENKWAPMTNEVFESNESTDKTKQASEEAIDTTLNTMSDSKPESVSEYNVTPTASSEEDNDVSETQEKHFEVDDISESIDYSLETFALHSPFAKPKRKKISMKFKMETENNNLESKANENAMLKEKSEQVTVEEDFNTTVSNESSEEEILNKVDDIENL